MTNPPVRTFFLLAIALGAAASLSLVAAEPAAPCLQEGNGRVVLVGDSITGQSRNAANGFAHLMDAALRAVYPEAKPEIVALGGSGQSVESWLGVEKGSRAAESYLDVKGIGVKAALDKPADVLVIMLGMNNVLAPYIENTPASLEQWTQRYQELTAALRVRLKPRVIALAGITPATEDPDSPKNKLIAAMNERVRALAQQEGARYLPAAETVWEIFRHGRTLQSDFHVTGDFVHPNDAGHVGIAIGMLTGLGEGAAADWLRTQRLARIWQSALGAKPTFSWQIIPGAAPDAGGRFSFRLTYRWPVAEGASVPVPDVTLTVPAGWQVTPASVKGATGTFRVTGNPDQERSRLTLQGRAGEEVRQAQVSIPAPWLVAAKLIQPCWNGGEFDAAKGRTLVDETIEKGGAFTATLDVGNGQTLAWQPLFPSVDFTGLDDPASVDFAAVTHAATFESGYGARWIHSDRDRPVQLLVGSQRFAGELYLTVWLNGQALYADKLARKTVDAQLKKGWNTLVFKANHRTWQWQVSVGVAGVGDDTLTDLCYAVRPPAAAD